MNETKLVSSVFGLNINGVRAKVIDSLAIVLTVASLSLVALAGNYWVHSAWDGMTWASPYYNIVSVADPGPGKQAGIKVSDVVVAIDGVPIAQRFPLYGSGPGGNVVFTISRHGTLLKLPMTLGKPPFSVLFLSLSNLAIACLFSTLSFAFSIGDRRSRQNLAFLIFYQLLAAIIASGSITSLQLGWAVRVFYACLSMMIPASFYMAISFPMIRRGQWVTVISTASSILGFVLALVFLFLPILSLQQSSWGFMLRQGTLVIFLLFMAFSLGIIADSFQRTKDALSRAAVRVSMLGLVISVLPFTLLYLIPRLILGQGVISGEIALLFLGVLPVYHGFSITRRRFSGLEEVLPAISSAVISGLIFICTIVSAMWLMRLIWHDSDVRALYAGVALGSAVLAALNVPVIMGSRRLVHRAFYGQEYDYQSVVSELSRDLAQAVGREELGELVVNTLGQRMKLTGVALLSNRQQNDYWMVEASSGDLRNVFDELKLPSDGEIANSIIRYGTPQRRELLSRALRDKSITEQSRLMLEDERLALWVPINVRGVLRGVAVLGNKQKAALFSREDLAIVGTLAGQIGVAMENANLYDNLRAEMRKLQAMQDQLVQAEKLSAVGELVSGVAHELNNPLTAVIGYAELLRNDLSDPQQRSDVEQILRCADRSRKIVRNLLTFARKQKTERKMVDLNEIVQQTLEIQAYQFRVDNIAIESSLDPFLPLTAADAGQLQQTLLNIVMNAHQAIKGAHESGKITVSTECHEGSILITVADDGPGMPAELLTKIFDPFFTTKEVGVGTGLGLSICYGIVRAHGGKIWCESSIGQGAKFFIELPVQKIEVAPLPTGEVSSTTNTGGRVLVVEDEAPVAAVLQRLLKKKGYTVDVTISGREALERLRSSADFYTLIISDIKMPDMGGIALWERLKELYPALSKRVIFVTGDTANMATGEFLESAGQPVLPKPFGTEELMRAITTLQG